ncbi:MAG: hypothetical protein EAZ92_05265 [Candidatus Kapaibacterium sp.]|nr:MAG: hypothetical protein EAZ92_05265 [Candidatus Kapabacteria bacterium]
MLPELFIIAGVLITLSVGWMPIFAQTSSLPAAFEPQEGRETKQNILFPPSNARREIHSLGFGIGVITGDASTGREVISFSTRYAQRLSDVELEIGLQHHSTAVSLQNDFAFRFVGTTWNGDLLIFGQPFVGVQNFRVGGGLSVRHQAMSVSTVISNILSSGMVQTYRSFTYQQNISAGATCKIEYILFQAPTLEMSIRGFANIYGMPLSGENTQVPRGTIGGAVGLELSVRTFFH